MNVKGAAKRLSTRVGLSAASVVVALLLAELVLRAAGYHQIVLLHYDMLTGVALIPGVEGMQHDEGRAFVHINRQGFRDVSRAVEKPADTFRIAVLGDSFVQATEVELKDTFPARLEGLLKTCRAAGHRSVEVLNFGVRSFGTAQELILLRNVVWRYQPDLVILTFFPGNDVFNAARELDGDRYKPYYRLVDGRLVPDLSYQQSVQRQLRPLSMFWYRTALRHSRLVQLVHQARKAAIQSRLGAGQPAVAANAWEVYPEMYREPTEKSWRDAWEVTDALLTEIKRETDAHGVPLLLVQATNGIDVYPGAAERTRLAREFGLADPAYPERRLAALGARHGFTVVALRDEFRRYADEHGVFLHGFDRQLGHGHWNAEGHGLAARILATGLCGPALRGLIH